MKRLFIIGFICMVHFTAFAHIGNGRLEGGPGRDSSLSVRKITDIRKRFAQKGRYFLDYVQNQNSSAQDGSFWINGNGTVGSMLIGTSTDYSGHKLQVKGPSLIQSGSAVFFAPPSDIDSRVGMLSSLDNATFEIRGINTINITKQKGGGNIVFGGFSWADNTREEYARFAGTGNLLIGTSTDAGNYKLQVNGGASFNNFTQVNGNSSVPFGIYSSDPTYSMLRTQNPNHYVDWGIESASGVMRYDGTTKLSVDGTNISTPNNLVVGTTVNAGYKLDVNGTGRFAGALQLDVIANESIDPDKILVSSSGVVKYMTKSQLGISGLASIPADRMIYGTGTGITSDPKFTYDAANNDLYLRSTPGFAHAGLFIGAAFYSPTSGLRLWHNGQSGTSYIDSRIDGATLFPLMINSGGQLTQFGGNIKVQKAAIGTSFEIAVNDLNNSSIHNDYTAIKAVANMDGSSGEIKLLDLEHINPGGTTNHNAYLLSTTAGFNNTFNYASIPQNGGIVIGKEKNSYNVAPYGGVQLPLYVTSPFNGSSTTWQGYFATGMGVMGAYIENTAILPSSTNAYDQKIGMKIESSGIVHDNSNQGTNYGLYINAKDADINYSLYANSGNAFFRDKVGIGIATPSANLHILGTVRFESITADNTKDRILTIDQNGNLFYRDLSSLNAGNASNAWSLTGNSSTTSDQFIGTTLNNTQPLVFKTNGSEAFRVNSLGEISIGTPNSHGYKLAVNGNILTQKIKVTQAGWPDYVFNSNYKLPSLKEVEEYIKQNKHLPDVPSAKEVEKNGLDLGANQTTLLKKIEELTLYIIDQDKKIEKLETQNKELSDIKKELEIINAKLQTKD